MKVSRRRFRFELNQAFPRTCLYEVLLHAEGEEAVSYAQATYVAASFIKASFIN
jgi:hypothetical protein